MSSPLCKLKLQNAAKVGRRTSYATREEHAARKHQTPLPYFRLEDSLCKSFLEIAKDPWEFEGLKLLFPFVREMSLLRFPRTQCKLSNWMQLAFMAGLDLGRGHPDRLEDVLPGLELREADRRVGVLRSASGEERLSSDALTRAVDVVINANWAEVPQNQLEAVILDASLRTLRTGYAAATVSRLDPTLFEFVADVPEWLGEYISDITGRLLVGAPRNAVGKPVGELLEHPLFKMAREKYAGQAIQCEAMLQFLRSQLRALAAKSENDCPVDEVAMLDWIGGGFRYRAWLKQEHSCLVQKIFDECDPQKSEHAKRRRAKQRSDSPLLNPHLVSRN
jgi:hypothetical protein